MSDTWRSFPPPALTFDNIFITQTVPFKTQPTDQTCTNIETSMYQAASPPPTLYCSGPFPTFVLLATSGAIIT